MKRLLRAVVILLVSPNIDRIVLTDFSSVSANIPSKHVPPSIQASLRRNKNKTELDEKIREQDKKILELTKKIETLMEPSPSIPPSLHPSLLSMLVTAPPKHKKELLGEKLFQLIKEMNPTLPDKITGKITSLLLDNENTDILFMLENKCYLHYKIQDCLKILIS